MAVSENILIKPPPFFIWCYEKTWQEETTAKAGMIARIASAASTEAYDCIRLEVLQLQILAKGWGVTQAVLPLKGGLTLDSSCESRR